MSIDEFSDKNTPHKPSADEAFKHDEGRFDDETMVELHDQLMREQAEPTEQYAPIPVFLMFIFGALLFWGGFYIAQYSGRFRGDVFDPNWTPGQAVKEEKAFDPLAKGKKLFAKTCQQCHQQDGKGLPGVYPPLDGSVWLLGDDVRPVKILISGLNGPIEVEGKSFNGNMPPVGQWKDRDIAAVLTFVRQNWSNKAGPISEELVAKVRESVKERKKPWTGSELLGAHPL